MNCNAYEYFELGGYIQSLRFPVDSVEITMRAAILQALAVRVPADVPGDVYDTLRETRVAYEQGDIDRVRSSLRAMKVLLHGTPDTAAKLALAHARRGV